MLLSAGGFVSWLPLVVRLRGVCTARWCWQGMEIAGAQVSCLCLYLVRVTFEQGVTKAIGGQGLSGPLANGQTERELCVAPLCLHHDPAAICVPSVLFMKSCT